jgi:threonine/homoserine/homoserine lactone efflux protein
MVITLPVISRSRNPFLRALSLLLGIAVIGVLLLFGLAVTGVLLVGGGLWLAWRQWKLRRAPGVMADARRKRSRGATQTVLEGEFVVIRQDPDQPR